MEDNTGVHDYSYDALSRLIAAYHPAMPQEKFTYDDVSNRASSLTSPNYIYDKDYRLLEDSKNNYSYDNNGNLVGKSSKITEKFTSYGYDSANELVRIEIFTDPLPAPPSTVVNYRYDGIGRRIEKNVNGQIKKYVYDGEDIVMELDGANNVTASYVHGPGIDNPISIQKSGRKYYYVKDGNGNVIQLTDEQGNVVQTYTYDSFGRIVNSAGNIDQPYKFTAREYDAESGLCYYRSRYYDPETGRFISRDAADGYLSAPISQNPYIYCQNNPILYNDPLGYSINTIFGGLNHLSALEAMQLGRGLGELVLGSFMMYQGTGFAIGGTGGTALSGGTATAISGAIAVAGVIEAGIGIVFVDAGVQKIAAVFSAAAAEGAGGGEPGDIIIDKQIRSNSRVIAKGDKIRDAKRLIEEYGGRAKE